MRHPRLKHDMGQTGYYHCISRCVGGNFLLGDEEKEYIRKLIWKAAQFCGMEVLTYCILNNHFHILVGVNAENLQEISDSELIERIAALFGRGQARMVKKLLAEDRKSGAEESAQELRERYLRRMGNVSVFMQEIKQRCSRWYNRRKESFGTIWAERFRSLLVEGSSSCLTAVAAYIDLNSVRAGIVGDPKDYRWCGYGEAVAGAARARRGLAIAVAAEGKDKSGWGRAGATYRKLMMGEVAPVPAESGDFSRKERLEVSPQLSRKILAEGGKLPLPELLRLRVRYFNDGPGARRQGIHGRNLPAEPKSIRAKTQIRRTPSPRLRGEGLLRFTRPSGGCIWLRRSNSNRSLDRQYQTTGQIAPAVVIWYLE